MEKKTIYAVTYASNDNRDNYLHVETKICFTEEEARKEYKACVNSIQSDFNEEEYYDTSWLDSYEFPNFISEFLEETETNYTVRVEKRDLEIL